MSNKTIISLSVLIVIMLGIITSAVIYLYSGLEPEIPVVQKAELSQAAVKPEAAASKVEDEPKPAAKQPKPETKPAAEPAKPETKPAVAKQPEPKSTPEQPKAAKPAPEQSFKVTNCATGKKNTLKQLSDNSLCLLDHNGKQLWKIPFAGRIIGSPAEIDIYNNLKIQFLIVEGSKLHAIDRLGREVRYFPVDLPAEATSGPKDIKHGKLVYWQIETRKGTVYFDKTTKKILTKLN